MAESGGILDSLWSLVSPRSAEAKVTATDPQAQEYVDNIATQNAPALDAFRKLLYATVLQKAQAEPAETRVGMSPDMRWTTLGDFHPQTQEIRLNTNLPRYMRQWGADPKTTLTHELLHFLAQQYGYTPLTSEQHQMIDYVLGPVTHAQERPGGYTEMQTQAGEPLAQGQMPTQVPGTQAFLARLFAGTPLQYGVLDRPRDVPIDPGIPTPRSLAPYQADWLGEQP